MPAMRSVPASLVLLGVVIALVAAWGGIVAFVGPTFGFSGDGSDAWRWTASHLFLALLPGAVAFVAGLLLIVIAPRTIDGRGRADLFLLGIVSVLCGAWFVVGPWAWPVLRTVHPYFVAAPPFRTLTVELGYALGPGLLLVLCGGIVVGWGIRHQRPIAPIYPAYPAYAPMPTVPPGVPAPVNATPDAAMGWPPSSDPVQPVAPMQPAVVQPAAQPMAPMQPPAADAATGVVPGQGSPGAPTGERPAEPDPTLTGAVPQVRPVPAEPTEPARWSTRPVPPAPWSPEPMPEPTTSTPQVQPEPWEAEPSVSAEPAQAEQAQPEAAQSEQAQPEPAQPEPPASGQAEEPPAAGP